MYDSRRGNSRVSSQVVIYLSLSRGGRREGKNGEGRGESEGKTERVSREVLKGGVGLLTSRVSLQLDCLVFPSLLSLSSSCPYCRVDMR